MLSYFICSTVVFASTYEYKQILGGSTEEDSKTIIIDPGNGDPDGGAVGVDGVIEKDINLSISLKLKKFFQTAGYIIIMTREGDREIYDEGSNTIRQKKFSDLKNRLAIMNSHPQAVFISIHQNIYKSSKNSGSVIFYSSNNETSRKLAQSIQDSITNMLQLQNTRTVSPAPKNIYLLYHAKSPAVLVECGFLSNPDECKLLQNGTYQYKIAFAIFCGVLKLNAPK